MDRLPPLRALRTFEAAARYESFNRAAEALHVTPSAVSHQIRTLEAYLGVALFRRRSRKVSLTPEGRAYLPAVHDAFEQILAATRELMRPGRGLTLTLSVAPAFALGWLMPRLPRFQLDHPDIEVRLVSSIELVDLSRLDVDIGIRTGRGGEPGLSSHRLMAEDLVPVCSPALTEGENGLRRPADLDRATLLHELQRMGQWRSWLNAVGLREMDAERGPKLQGGTMAMNAAISGLGVALAPRPLVQEHLESRRLVIPFEVDLPSESAYRLVYLESRAGERPIAAFRHWILDAVKADSGELVGPDGA